MKTQITKIKDERRDVATDHKEKIVREYYEELDSLAEVNTFSERHKLLKLIEGEYTHNKSIN